MSICYTAKIKGSDREPKVFAGKDAKDEATRFKLEKEQNSDEQISIKKVKC